MDEERLYIDGKTLCIGVQWATSRSEEPILCLIKADSIKFVAVSGLRLVISWETRLRQSTSRNLAFLIPPLIAELLSSEAICAQVGVEFAVRGKHVVALLTDHLGSYEIRWESDLASFPAPDGLGHLVQVPAALVEVPHLSFSDATHRAIAKLAQMEADQQINATKLAILIDIDFGRLSVEGQEIVASGGRQYYFDPRLVIRALEFLKEKTLRVGITPLQGLHRGYLSLASDQEGWTIHCALLSVGKETQRLYPLPPGRNR